MNIIGMPPRSETVVVVLKIWAVVVVPSLIALPSAVWTTMALIGCGKLCAVVRIYAVAPIAPVE